MKKLRLGIFGMRRGFDYLDAAEMNGFTVTAVCDADETRLAAAKERLPAAAVFTDPEAFLQSPMDAVFLANFFHEHAFWAIRFLEKGVHVLSECASNATMAQGVQLARAAEKSGAVYMLAENYPFMLFNREMKRVYEGGTLGKALYAEGPPRCVPPSGGPPRSPGDRPRKTSRSRCGDDPDLSWL